MKNKENENNNEFTMWFPLKIFCEVSETTLNVERISLSSLLIFGDLQVSFIITSEIFYLFVFIN